MVPAVVGLGVKLANVVASTGGLLLHAVPGIIADVPVIVASLLLPASMLLPLLASLLFLLFS